MQDLYGDGSQLGIAMEELELELERWLYEDADADGEWL